MHLQNSGAVAMTTFLLCPNPECKKYTFEVRLYEGLIDSEGRVSEGGLIKMWRLVPTPGAKSFPSYIPDQIKNDYQEACLIKELSSRASATLSRRCMQGMIRDFWGIKKDNLKLEIDAIRDKCDSLTWDAIDALRNIGNIGAHMEEDINLIIDVDPDEAGLLINLIEDLLKRWYVEKHEREEMRGKIVEIAKKKEAMKKKS
jgi:hypothetical protein